MLDCKAVSHFRHSLRHKLITRLVCLSIHPSFSQSGTLVTLWLIITHVVRLSVHSIRQQVSQTICQSVSQSVSRSVSRSVDRSVSQSVSQSANVLVRQLTSRHSVNWCLSFYQAVPELPTRKLLLNALSGFIKLQNLTCNFQENHFVM